MPTKRTDARPRSRRTLLIAAATGRRSQAEVAYQDHPHGDERREVCAPFLSPDQCRVVVGPVSRQGWRKVFTGPDKP